MATTSPVTDDFDVLIADMASLGGKMVTKLSGLFTDMKAQGEKIVELEARVAQLETQISARDEEIARLKEGAGTRVRSPPQESTGAEQQVAGEQQEIRCDGDAAGGDVEPEGSGAASPPQEDADELLPPTEDADSDGGEEADEEVERTDLATASQPAVPAVKYPVTKPVKPHYKIVTQEGPMPGSTRFFVARQLPRNGDYIIKIAPGQTIGYGRLPEDTQDAIRRVINQYPSSNEKYAGSDWFKNLHAVKKAAGSRPICLHLFLCTKNTRTEWTVENLGEYACLSCTNQQRPCLRWDQHEKKIVVLPLVEEARSGATPRDPGYWVRANDNFTRKHKNERSLWENAHGKKRSAENEAEEDTHATKVSCTS